MATLEIQYENFLKENPTSSLTYDEWLEKKITKLSEAINKLQNDNSENLQNGNEDE